MKPVYLYTNPFDSTIAGVLARGTQRHQRAAPSCQDRMHETQRGHVVCCFREVSDSAMTSRSCIIDTKYMASGAKAEVGADAGD